MSGFCGWQDFARAIVAAGIFNISVSSCYLVIWVIGWGSWYDIYTTFSVGVMTGPDYAMSTGSYFGILALLSVLDLAIVLASMGLLISVNRNSPKLMLPWLIIMPFYMLYEVAAILFFIILLVFSSGGLASYVVPLLFFWTVQVIVNMAHEVVVATHYHRLRQATIKSKRPILLTDQTPEIYPKFYTPYGTGVHHLPTNTSPFRVALQSPSMTTTTSAGPFHQTSYSSTIPSKVHNHSTSATATTYPTMFIAPNLQPTVINAGLPAVQGYAAFGNQYFNAPRSYEHQQVEHSFYDDTAGSNQRY